MKLWLLRPCQYDDRTDWTGPWEAFYDCHFGFVIRAETEEEARAMANTQAGDEGKAWADPNLADCTELLPDGSPGLVIEDFRAG